MAKAKKLKKKIKRLKRKLVQQSGQARKAKKEVKDINRELKARSRIIAELRSRISADSGGASGTAGVDQAEYAIDKGLAIEQKNAWKKHRFLCERYDAHLDAGHDKDEARALANKDLVDSHGNKAGFTTEELRCILS